MEDQRSLQSLYQWSVGKGVDAETGLVIPVSGAAVNYIPYPVRKGCVIEPADPAFEFQAYFYSSEIPGELIHTYCYQDESNWASFRADLSAAEWTKQNFDIPADGFVRIAVRTERPAGLLTDQFRFRNNEFEPVLPDWMVFQTEKLTERADQLRQNGDLSLFLLTDTHFAVNGIWLDTLRSMKLCAERAAPDAVLHLGDFSDGLLPGELTRAIVNEMRDGLEGICGTLWCCVGNHDVNYFRGNPDRFTRSDCAALYLRRKNPWYFMDLSRKKLRLIFLDSFDPNNEKERYGFAKEELPWFERTLRDTPKGWQVLIFSHVPPAAEIHVWSKTIRNGETVLKIAERFHKQRGGAVLAWIHGHNHADLVWQKRKFPIVGIGCAKLEDFRDHKPEGSLTWDRVRGTDSQELWDLLLVHRDGSMDFLRYGAGHDRHVEKKVCK